MITAQKSTDNQGRDLPIGAGDRTQIRYAEDTAQRSGT